MDEKSAENKKTSEGNVKSGVLENVSQKMIPKSSELGKSALDCEALMQQIYEGNYFLLPVFAQSLISFLYEGMPASDNPRVFGHHIATRGMHILQRAHEMGMTQEHNANSKSSIEALPYKGRILRDCVFISCGVAIQAGLYTRALIVLFLSYKFCDEYRLITKNYNQLIDFIFILFVAYFWCR